MMQSDNRLSNAINTAVVRGVKLTLTVSLCRFLIRLVLAIKGLVVMALFWRVYQYQGDANVPFDNIPLVAAAFYLLICLLLVITGKREKTNALNGELTAYFIFLASCLFWPMWTVYAGLSFSLKLFDWIQFLDEIERGKND